MQLTHISTPIAEVTVSSHGLITVLFTQDGEVDETYGTDILSAIVHLANKKEHVVLYDFNSKDILIRNIARQFVAVRNEHESHILGRAFLCYSLQNQLEAKHFIHYNKPLAETRIFNTLTKAAAWLEKKMQKPQSKR
jgi:hypothetical protein